MNIYKLLKKENNVLSYYSSGPTLFWENLSKFLHSAALILLRIELLAIRIVIFIYFICQHSPLYAILKICEFKSEWESVKKAPFKKKAADFWTYYKWFVIIPLIIIIGIASNIYNIVTDTDTVLNVIYGEA